MTVARERCKRSRRGRRIFRVARRGALGKTALRKCDRPRAERTMHFKRLNGRPMTKTETIVARGGAPRRKKRKFLPARRNPISTRACGRRCYYKAPITSAIPEKPAAALDAPRAPIHRTNGRQEEIGSRVARITSRRGIPTPVGALPPNLRGWVALED